MTEFQKDKRPKVGLATFIRKDGKILLGKRKSSPDAGVWCLTGGHLEFMETFEECAKRETFEEAGIEIKNVRFITATNDFFTRGADNVHYVTIFMVADYKSGEVKLMEPDKFDAWEWCSWDELPENLMKGVETCIKMGINPLEYS